MNRLFYLFLMICFGSCQSEKYLEDSSFYQTVKSEVPITGNEDVRALVKVGDRIIAVGDKGVFEWNNGNWTTVEKGSDWKGVTVADEGQIWVYSNQVLKSIDSDKVIPLPEVFSQDSIQTIRWIDSKIYAGYSTGLKIWDRDIWETYPQISGFKVSDIVADSLGVIWVATHDGLWTIKGQKVVNLDETLMAVGTQRTYFSLNAINGGKDIMFGAPLSVGCIKEDGEHFMWSGVDGLPYGPVTGIYQFGENYWFATNEGAIKRDSTWHYFNGKRWLADNQINDIIEIDANTVWIATPKGISEIRDIPMTLAQKAQHYEEIIDARHNRRGIINYSHLKISGDLSTSFTRNEDNDGLWTACYLLGQCYRYAVTGDEDAKKKAVATFEALERLELITGISGYPARSYALATDSVVQSSSPHAKKWHYSKDGKWQWLDDTSSDEITGHFYTILLFSELVADADQKERSIQLLDRIATHIVDNDYHMIDEDGKPTRWGVWHPDSMNHAPNWMYERNLYALQILSHLKVANQLTKNEKYNVAYQELIDKHGYADNMVQAKIYGPYETSHSDDILNFFPYYGLLKFSEGDPNHPKYIQSLERTWKNVAADRMPVWNVIASSILGKDCGLKVAKEELEQYPLDLVDWTMKNSHRWDLVKDPLVDRGGKVQAVKPIKTPESSVSRWNTNPKKLDTGAGGTIEESGTYYLAAYWMGKYYKYW